MHRSFFVRSFGELQQPFLARHLRRLAPRGDVQLRQNISDVRLDRVQADIQRGGDLFICRAVGGLDQNLLFAFGQAIVVFLVNNPAFAQPPKF